MVEALVCYKLRMFGVKLSGPARVKSSTLPESRLKKKHCYSIPSSEGSCT